MKTLCCIYIDIISQSNKITQSVTEEYQIFMGKKFLLVTVQMKSFEQ